MSKIVYHDQRELHADFLDHFQDYIVHKHESWYFDNIELVESKDPKVQIIDEFVKWLKDQAEKDLLVKRGKDNLSYEDVRQKYLAEKGLTFG